MLVLGEKHAHGDWEEYRFESCHDYKKRVSYSKKNKQNRDPKGCVGSSPTEEATPDGGIGRHTGQKNGNP